MSEYLSKVIQNNDLFSKKDKLLVAVSGGMDSMVLCHILFENNYQFIIAHCNYHLRGEESLMDEQFVVKWANERNIPCFKTSCPILSHSNIQEQARNLRYQFLSVIRLQEKCKYILTAHHQDDQIESFFINLSRGSGTKGLRGMVMKNKELIRPFLNSSKSQIEEYAKIYLIEYRLDQSNDEIKYLRNYFRNKILRDIKLKLPSFPEMLLRSMNHISEVEELLENLFHEWKKTYVIEKEDEIIIDKPIKNQLFYLSRLLIEYDFHPNTIQEIKNNIDNVGKLFLNNERYNLLIDREQIILQKSSTIKTEETYSIETDEGQLKTKIGLLSWKLIPIKGGKIILPKSLNEAIFDPNALRFPLQFRKWMSGERICPLGMNGKSKKIKDVLIDNKISRFDKGDIFILNSDVGVLWIPKLIRSDLAKVKSTEKYCLKFTLKEI